MKKRLLYIAVLGMLAALAGCGQKEKTEEPQIGSAEKTEGVTESQGSEITQEAEQKTISYLTGLPIDKELEISRPLAVMLNNIEAGCPQSGIADAAIVYEAPVEGRITRLMAIYDDYRNLEKV